MALADAVADLDEAVGEFLRSGSAENAAVLAAVFKLNNQIGPLLRSTGDPALRRLQLEVNDVTVAAKHLDRGWLKEAMKRVRAEALKLQPKG